MAVTVASEINQVPASRFVRTLKDVREAKDSKAAHAQERKRMRNEPGKFSLAKGCELGTQSVPDASPSRRMHVQARLFTRQDRHIILQHHSHPLLPNRGGLPSRHVRTRGARGGDAEARRGRDPGCVMRCETRDLACGQVSAIELSKVACIGSGVA